MFRFQTLGGLVLSDSDGKPVALQRRRLALLAPGQARRASLVRELRGECPARARALLYSIRRQFPPNGFFTGTDPIRLDSNVVQSDVKEFESALGRGDLSGAIALYRGPFLDGFYLADEGFEEWVEDERQRLAGLYAETLHRLAKDAGAERHHTEAIAS